MPKGKSYFEKRRGKQPDRKMGNWALEPISILIVSEGEKTEPLYFNGLRNYINNKYGKYGDGIQNKPIIQTEGEGKSTVNLVREAQKLEKRGNRKYNQVWIVFDKDDFSDFDDAIRLAESLGYHAAWNNRSFEYWIFLHFHFSDSQLDQSGWTEKISIILKDQKIDSIGYKMFYAEVFEVVTQNGGLKRAVKHAQMREQACKGNKIASQCNPCTMVHHLIQELAPYLSELLE